MLNKRCDVGHDTGPWQLEVTAIALFFLALVFLLKTQFFFILGFFEPFLYVFVEMTVWLCSLSVVPCTKRSLVQLPVKAHAWVRAPSPVQGVHEAANKCAILSAVNFFKRASMVSV